MAAAKKQQREDQLEAKILESARVDDDHEIDEDDLDEEEEEFGYLLHHRSTGASRGLPSYNRTRRLPFSKSSKKQAICVFSLPKFHSELNPIERYWAILKVHTRRNCRFNINAVERSMLSAVNQDFGDYISAYSRLPCYVLLIPLDLMTRMPRRCQIFGCKADVEEGALFYLVFVLMLT